MTGLKSFEQQELEVSNHYKGAAGAHYVSVRQNDQDHLGHALEFGYFKPFLQIADCVLDFGCGNGGMLRLMAQYVRKAVGVEVNASAAEIARSAGLTVYPSLEALPDDEAYDVVVSNHVLEHVRDVPSTLEHIRRKIRKGGLVLLKLPMEDWRSADSKRWSTDDIDHHLQTWTPKLIGNVMYESGFEVDDIKIITSAWHPKLFPLARFGLSRPAFWVLSVAKRRRQLFVIGKVN